MEKSVNVYKHLLFRIAGESFSLLKENQKIYEDLRYSIISLIALEKSRDNLKSEICDLIFALINAVQTQLKNYIKTGFIIFVNQH